MSKNHEPVLTGEVVAHLILKQGGRYVDATLGLGGHSRALLDADPRGSLLGLDRHAASMEAARAALRPYGCRVTLQNLNFTDLSEAMAAAGWTAADGILADLGISRWQLEGAVPGLSFQRDEPLDMRLDGTGVTAAEIVNDWPVRELARVLKEYGEEPLALRIARRIGEVRGQAPIRTTHELADLVASVKHPRRGDSLHPATLTFMALRIAVNDELTRLRQALPQCRDRLRPGGRLSVITFHSLEDRIVKETFRAWEKGCICPPGLPVCACGLTPTARSVHRKSVVPGGAEIDRNPRARSARLRTIERTEP
jgi:16S rRNA (cytosine1402-N4)-methyltransferase